MATITLNFKVPRTEIPSMFALMEADNTPACELRVKKPNGSVCEIEIATDELNADYFRDALGGA